MSSTVVESFGKKIIFERYLKSTSKCSLITLVILLRGSGKLKKIFMFVAVVLVIAMSLTVYGKLGVGTEVKGATIQGFNESYRAKVDVDYAFQVAKSLEEFKSNEKLGYRPAGSDAEIKTGLKIAEEMKNIGLQEVTGDKFLVDKWEFEKADLVFWDKDGNEHLTVLGGYQINFNTNGFQEFELVYAGKGTSLDYEGLDVTEKLVLVDINQRDEWWVNYPAYQAYLKGAAALLVVQEAGYSEIDPDAVNAQDICGPDYAPVFSISQTDANILKETIASSQTGTAKVKFDAKSEVTFDQETFNYHGKIVGKDPNSYIILSGHYDSYFSGFQDDNAAIGLLLGVAKAMIESGYKPEKTIIFMALAAEEWGVSNTRYDWSTGAYNQIFRVRPEWAEKTVLNMNFELPAYEHTMADEIRASYELKNYLEEFAASVPKVDGVYQEGISVVAPSRTWSDDFSFSLAGIPALRNDFQDSNFMRTHYHTQFDNEDTFNEKALLFHLKMYGLLTIYYDRTAVVPLDFTVRLNALKDSVDQEVFDAAGVSSGELLAQIDTAIAAAKKVNEKVAKINADYTVALDKGDSKAIAKLYEESKGINQKLLKAFKFAQDNLVRLTWEDEPIFPHEHSQSNLKNVGCAIDALQTGDVETALDEYLWLVDNNWYAYHFDQEVHEYFTDYTLSQPAERLMWGAGRIMDHEDLYEVVHSLLAKSGSQEDVTAEIRYLQDLVGRQVELLADAVKDEIASIKVLAEMLNN